jgi:tungstate transport system permease protein
MQEFAQSFADAARLIASGNADLAEVVLLSMQVSLSAVVIAALIGLPLGALLAVARFPGRGAAVVVVNALMGFPPVVIGLLVYLALSNAGPLGPLRLLYTPTAMIIAQVILVTPIIASLTRSVVADLDRDYAEQLDSLRVRGLSRLVLLLIDARAALVVALLAGFGRAIAEVGAVMIVGGNINHVTRVMTTAIALETSKGELAMALALGAVLLALSLGVNAAVSVAAPTGRMRHA